MSRDSSALLHDALLLPERERASLAAELLRSLDREEPPLDPAEYDLLWGAAIERRLREVDEGTVKPVAWSDARRRIADE